MSAEYNKNLRQNYVFVDALRGCAVLLVLCYHIIMILGWSGFPERGLTKIFHAGWIGVDLFFVISGFVIALSILHGIERSGNPGFVRDSARHRLARLVPLYYLTMLLCITCIAPQSFWLATAKIRFENITSHLLFIHNWFQPYAVAINDSAWTLGVEMQFYALIALTLAFWPQKRALSLALAGIAIAILWRAFCYWLWQGNFVLLLHALQQLPGTLDGFFIGAAIALVCRANGHFLHKYMQPGARNTFMWCALALLAGLAAWHTYWLYPHSDFSYWGNAPMTAFWRTLLALTFALFLLTATTLPAHKWLVRCLAPLLYIGKISYGIYLWHLPVIHAIMKTGLPSGRMAALATLSTLLLASFSWYFFEKPLIDRYRK
ncbi:MAG: acyltransferase [Ottowia sp.]|nr:acyltransferase [Ottowia sp.]